jgi:NhaP-type Na+/H+ or K+/H+ antiporter
LGRELWALFFEAPGGVALGVGAGFGVFMLLRSVDEYSVEVLITLGLAAGVYSVAEALHVSARRASDRELTQTGTALSA